MACEHRLQEASGFGVALERQVVALAVGAFIEHAWPGVGEALVVGADETHRAHVGLVQGVVGNVLQQHRVAADQGGGGEWRNVFGDHLAALQQLGLHIGLLYPGEIAAQYQCQPVKESHGL